MRLSGLQTYILLKCFDKKGRIERKGFREFYSKKEKAAFVRYQEGIVTKSLERLVDKEFLIGFGRRTPHKWFVTHVQLTKKGKKQAQQILQDHQKKLPLR